MRAVCIPCRQQIIGYELRDETLRPAQGDNTTCGCKVAGLWVVFLFLDFLVCTLYVHGFLKKEIS